jgi:hypothetical protein
MPILAGVQAQLEAGAMVELKMGGPALALNERIRRHINNLAALENTLQCLGMRDSDIRVHVSEISQEFQAELAQALFARC